MTTFRNRTIAAVFAVATLATACGSAASTETSVADQTPATESAEAGLILDYTAFIAGAIQPSGIGISPDGSQVAIVTDFEKVVVAETATQEVANEFAVGRRDLPRQGATEAIAFVSDDELAVLYPDDAVVGFFDGSGTPLREIEIDVPGGIDGAMAVLAGELVVVARADGTTSLAFVDPASGSTRLVETSDATLPIEGLSPGADGGLVGVDNGGTVYEIDPETGAFDEMGEAADVDEPSGLEIFVNVSEAEVQIAVTDDADAYNDEPSPLRLYVR